MFRLPQPFKGVVQRKVPIYFVLLAAILPIIGYYLSRNISNSSINNSEITSKVTPTSPSSNTDACDINMEQNRLNNYSLVHPLLMTDLPKEDTYLLPLKIAVSDLLEQRKNMGDISTASVYLRRLNSGGWMSVNGSEQYSPSSMFKIPILITFFKMQEVLPGLFEKELALEANMIPNKTQYIEETHLAPGRYKIRDLLYAMIVKSDNYATMLLNMHIDQNIFEKTFTDLGMKKPEIKSPQYLSTPKEFACFWRVLNDATYLNAESSESVLELLSQTEFKAGIVAGLPVGVKVSHKFGESGDGKSFELHESGIIYLEGAPYLLVVMTRGNDIKKLAPVLQSISKTIYDKLSVPA